MSRDERYTMFTDDYSEFINALAEREAQVDEWNEAILSL